MESIKPDLGSVTTPTLPPIRSAGTIELRPVSPERQAQITADIEAERRSWKCQQWECFIRRRGKRYDRCTLENFVAECDAQHAAIDRLAKYAANVSEQIATGQGILWLGPPGTGKDHLQAAMVAKAIGVEKSVEWRNGVSLFQEFRDAMDARGTSEADIIRPLVRADVLALSDPVPPSGPLTDYQRGMLFRIIDARYSDLRPTWVTLNVANRREAEDRIGTQTVDRLSHGSLVIVCNWPSWRQRKE